jgi:hypothetical protein
MVLTDEQKQAVAAWIEEGAKPADVQARLEKDFEIRMTYMEVRFLIDDLKVMPKDPPPPPQPPAPQEPEAAAPAAADDADVSPLEDSNLIPSGTGKVAVKVDDITRPGAMVSGRCTFSDGKTSEWYLDQYGRLGMIPSEPGYRPPQADVAEFQAVLEKELVKLGF